jgi:hypothetical protein
LRRHPHVFGSDEDRRRRVAGQRRRRADQLVQPRPLADLGRSRGS